MTIDYTVNWLHTATLQSASDANDQKTLNALICNIMRSTDTNIPAENKYVLAAGSDKINTAWGVSTTGILLFNAISGDGVDPFYPAKYGSVSDPSKVVEKVDACLQHPQP